MSITTIPQFPETGGVGIDQVLPFLSIKRTALYDWMSKGLFPRPRKLGRRSVWLAEEVRQWLKDQPVADIGTAGLRHICK